MVEVCGLLSLQSPGSRTRGLQHEWHVAQQLWLTGLVA